MRRTELDRRHCLARLGVAGAALCRQPARAQAGTPSAIATVDHEASSPEWERLRPRLFGQRSIQTGPASLIQLKVPLRAAYGASVPVRIIAGLRQTPERYLRRLTLLVDKNPSGVAATLQLTPALGQADLETRLKVDEYSHVRAIGELNTGELHMGSRFVKVSGGCSAPPNRDAPELIGKTRLRLPEGLMPAGQPTPAEVSVIHPNDTGFELNQVSLLYIPSYFVRTIRVHYDEQLLFDADTDFSISENPSWRFDFLARPDGGGQLRAEVEDSHDGHYRATLDLAGAPRAGGA